jgi:adenine-specific DNA-methyltransferase
MDNDNGRSASAGEAYRGRLELTWTNKHLRLLAHEDGTYQWLPPADYRVSEVRLLRDAGTVGKTHDDSGRAKDNLLVRGDALHALTSLSRIREFAREYVGKVRLAYLDPPFNTQQAFEQYDDALEHSVWLTMMRDRLALVKDLLTPDGSVWVHCDDSEQAYLKVVMDELFGRDSWVTTIVWQKRLSRDNRAAFSSMHDYILVYSPMGLRWSQVRNRLTDEGSYSNPDNDPKGPWRSIPLSAQAGHATPAQFYDVVTPAGVRHPPPKGRAWTYTEERFKELIKEGRVYWPKQGRGRPRLKMYPWESQGLVPFTIWPASEVGDNDEAKKQILDMFPEEEAFDTPKPERLLKRIIEIGSNEGDVVLDCFLGSGTTSAVAHKVSRRWIGVEWSVETLEKYAIPRLKMVADGTDQSGITDDVAWEGGEGFRMLDIAPSMFEEDGGVVVLADWAVNSDLAEASAAQLGYHFEPDPPFCGRKGRGRLAVVDGLVNESVVTLLAQALPDDERLVVCGTGIDPSARETLRKLRPGSTMRRIPASILSEYRQAYRRFRVSPTAEPSDADGDAQASLPLKQSAPDG